MCRAPWSRPGKVGEEVQTRGEPWSKIHVGAYWNTARASFFVDVFIFSAHYSNYYNTYYYTMLTVQSSITGILQYGHDLLVTYYRLPPLP